MYPAKPSKTVPVLVGGVTLGVLSAIPPISFLNCACCMLVIAGGLLASYLYMKNYPAGLPPVTYGDGALLGVLAGIVGAVVSTALSIPVNLLFSGFGLSQSGALKELKGNPEVPPQLVDFLEQMFEGGITATAILFSLIFGAVIYSIFAAIGGMLGIALFGSRRGGPPGSGGAVGMPTPGTPGVPQPPPYIPPTPGPPPPPGDQQQG